MPLRGLTLIVADADPARFDAALTLAAAQAASGGEARLYFHGIAVTLLEPGLKSEDDDRRGAAGLPTLLQLRATAADLGVRFTACQSGLAAAGITADSLPPGTDTGGMVALLATLGEDRLIFA